MSADLHNLFAGFDKAMEGIMSSPSALAEYRRMRAEQDAREAKLMAELREHGLDAMEHLTSALRHPRTSAWDIAQAIAALLKAREAAQELDPPEAA